MYLIIRCGNCRTFTYVDRYQEWKLCPHCGEAIKVRQTPAYLEVDDYSLAEKIIRELEGYLERTQKKDLSPEEKESLRHHTQSGSGTGYRFTTFYRTDGRQESPAGRRTGRK